MKWRRAVAWVLRATLGMYVAIAPAYAADEEARVLILNGIDPYLPAYLAIDGAMRASLAKDEARRIVFFSEALDGQRFSPEALEPEFLALLEKKYRAVHIDVVVAFSIPALEFFKRHGAHLWPGARLVFHGFPGEDIRPETLPPNATAVEARPDVDGTIELAQRLQPDARRIVVIAGVSDLDRRAEQLARGALSKPAEHATSSSCLACRCRNWLPEWPRSPRAPSSSIWRSSATATADRTRRVKCCARSAMRRWHLCTASPRPSSVSALRPVSWNRTRPGEAQRRAGARRPGRPASRSEPRRARGAEPLPGGRARVAALVARRAAPAPRLRYPVRRAAALAPVPMADRRHAGRHRRTGSPDRVVRAPATTLFASRPRAHWCELLEGSDVCFAPVLSLAEAAGHPHMAARGIYRTVAAGAVHPAAAPRFEPLAGEAP